ncbi:hypothetical protein BHS06_10640 [Myxococcus xanthus]|nr:hypothetical protein BHS06_10640 [Myxococcus xanthus]
MARQETVSAMPPTAKPSQTAQDLPAPSFPAIESLLEAASVDEVRGFFDGVKTGLTELKGPKVEQGKKAQAAIGRAEELLEMLVETRERLIAESKGGKGRK